MADGKAYRKLTPEQWSTVRAQWELGGISYRDLGDTWGVSHTVIQNRKKRENWLRDPTKPVEQATLRKVAEKVAKAAPVETSESVGLPPVPETLTPDQVVERLAEERSDVIIRHQQEWLDWRRKYFADAEAVFKNPPKIVHRTFDAEGNVTSERFTNDYSLIAEAKRLAESVSIQQKAERLAHSLDHNMNTTKAQDIVARDQMVESTFKAIRDAALEVRRRAKEDADAEMKTINAKPTKE